MSIETCYMLGRAGVILCLILIVYGKTTNSAHSIEGASTVSALTGVAIILGFLGALLILQAERLYEDEVRRLGAEGEGDDDATDRD